MRVVVIGAGLGGLCLAQGLLRAGVEVAVYERDAAISARFQGYRIGLAEQGESALRDCLPERLHPLLTATMGDLEGARPVLDHRLNPVGDLGPAAATAIDRQVLRQLLAAGLGPHLRFGREFTDYRVRPDSRVSVSFSDGTETVADLLVGADGVNSAVRGRLSPETRPFDTGVRFVVGRTPLDERFAKLVPGFGTVIKTPELTLMLGLMKFREPPKRAAARYAPEVVLSDTADYLRWVTMPGSPKPLAELMAGWHPELRAVVKATDAVQSAELSIRVVRPGARWPAGPVTLLGDAIHATSPSGGNGANTALHDANLLRRKLTEVLHGRLDLTAALSAYERDMFDYGTTAVDHSLQALPAFTPQRTVGARIGTLPGSQEARSLPSSG
ncbi:FAD-dependent oxidoreductase [Amycolatopsis nigrescens]|uniref:FAD-dependent oxidoreductase n=1 Tax=Amycolatopsis nigrescens TaxID=381445 RepID=UPI0003A2776A|nr:NAD(P)/FAD-dependent oxidoreductase [Amycolatopsis nigrescens]